MRTEAAHIFVDSLRASASQSYVGSVIFADGVLTQFGLPPILLSDQVGYDTLWNSLEQGANTPQLRKTLKTLDTYQGLGLTASLDMLINLGQTVPGMKQHIIMITDDGWFIEDDVTPEEIFEQYRPQFPDTAFPKIHTVVLTQSGNPQGDSIQGLANIQMIADSTGGLYIDNATPETIVATLLQILNEMIVIVPNTLEGMSVTNLTNGEVRNHTSILPLQSNDSTIVRYQSTIDNLPIEFGANTIVVKRVVTKAESDQPVEEFDTVTIFRTEEWISEVDVTSAEYLLHCVEDSTNISIGVTPPWQLINNPFTVNSTIILKDKMRLDTVEVRLFTTAQDSDQTTDGVFHLDGDLTNSTNGAAATGTVAFTATDTLFGTGAITAGSFTTPLSATADGNFALETWIKPTATPTVTDIFFVGGLYFGITADRTIYIRTAEAILATSVTAVGANTWSHIALSKSNNTITLFINGINVTDAVPFDAAVSGDVLVTCPNGAALDEIRISKVHRIRADSQGKFVRFDVPVLSDALWTVGGTASQPKGLQILTPNMWNNGSISFQFTSLTPGTFVVNFQHKGTELKTQWSINGNPVTAANPGAPFVSIVVTPDTQLVNKQFTVKSTMQLSANSVLKDIQVRVFTQFPDTDPNAVAVYHFERSLVNTITGKDATGTSITYTDTDALFGECAINAGTFSTSVGTLSEFAFEAWIKPSPTVQQTDIFSIGGNSFGISEEGTLYFKKADGTTLTSNQIVPHNSWSHIAVSRANNTVLIYLNGINVSESMAFDAVLSGVTNITCPSGAVLDEIRISNTHRVRPDSQDPFFRLAIPSVENVTWTLAGNQSTSPYLVLAPNNWINNAVQFEFAGPVPGRLVVNFQHNGIVKQTQFSINGNPVFAASDLEGPYVTKGIYYLGPLGDFWDTLRVFFSEPVLCDSLKKNLDPGASFNIYGPDNILKPGIFDGSYYLDGDDCPSERITQVTIIVEASVNSIRPTKDFIQLFGTVVDTAGNPPDTTKRGPIEWGPGSGLIVVPQKSPEDQPMTIPPGIKQRLGLDLPSNVGKAIIIQTRGPLDSIITPTGEVSYGKTMIFDPVANVVRADLLIKQFPGNERLYYIIWDGTNRYRRRIASGAYLLTGQVMYLNDLGKMRPLPRKKFSIKWSNP